LTTRGCVLLLLVAGLPVDAAAGKEVKDDCPLTYERHSLEEIASGEKRPWLFDGAYYNGNFDGRDRNGRLCVNCHRGRCGGIPRAGGADARARARARRPLRIGVPARGADPTRPRSGADV
jgi:hypothetical protein